MTEKRFHNIENFSEDSETRENIKQLKSQYLEMAQLSKSVYEYLMANPEAKKQEVLDQFSTEELKNSLSSEQLMLVEKQIKEFTFNRGQVSKLAEVFAQDTTKSLNEHIFENYIKSGMLPDFSGAQAEFFTHNGMLVLKIDKPHFKLISEKIVKSEITPDGFVYNASEDQGATAMMKFVIKEMTIIPSDIKTKNQTNYLNHESKHVRNKYTFPEYLLNEFKGKKLRYDIRMLKEEITAGIEEGASFTDLAFRLYGEDIYNGHNEFIKECRERFFKAQNQGDETEVQTQATLIEKAKIDRQQFRQWFLAMFEQASQVMQDYPDIGNELLSVTPAKHWKLFAKPITTIELEAIKGYMNVMDKEADEFAESKEDKGFDPYKALRDKQFRKE